MRKAYTHLGAIVGLPWWLMWIPGAVAVGFDIVMHPNCLYPSLLIGVVGLGVSLWLYRRVMKSETAAAQKWQKSFAGESIAAAYLALKEIRQAQIH